MLTLDLGLALTDGVTQTLVRRELFGVRGWLSLVSCAPVMHHWELMPKSPRSFSLGCSEPQSPRVVTGYAQATRGVSRHLLTQSPHTAHGASCKYRINTVVFAESISHSVPCKTEISDLHCHPWQLIQAPHPAAPEDLLGQGVGVHSMFGSSQQSPVPEAKYAGTTLCSVVPSGEPSTCVPQRQERRKTLCGHVAA